jgi:hypothetical protein
MTAIIRNHSISIQAMNDQIQIKEQSIFKLNIENCKLWNQVEMITEENIILHDIEDQNISLQY